MVNADSRVASVTSPTISSSARASHRCDGAESVAGQRRSPIENSPTDLRAQVFRQGYGANRANYADAHIADTLALGRATVNVGVRFDHQWGSALPSTIAANPAFPTLVPGLTFAGYASPFVWNNLSPRAGISYAVDADRHTIVRAAYSRYAGQLSPTTIGINNPSSTAGSATYRWVDLNGDHLAQANEVLTDQRLTQGGDSTVEPDGRHLSESDRSESGRRSHSLWPVSTTSWRGSPCR